MSIRQRRELVTGTRATGQGSKQVRKVICYLSFYRIILMAELTAVSSRKGRVIATLLNFHVSHGSATRFLRNGEKYYIHFMDNLLLLTTAKKFKIGKQLMKLL